MAQPGALDLGRGIKGRNEGLGLVPQDKNQEEGNGVGVTKICKKKKNMRIVPNHSIHINLTPCHCSFVTL